mmetsp:Transcript_40411/g.90621  ORF Transcript_40411/g.90621 Transcript_40411/m.90621 type:complete len:261 (+) Transcript_40411:37-819(+)
MAQLLHHGAGAFHRLLPSMGHVEAYPLHDGIETRHQSRWSLRSCSLLGAAALLHGRRRSTRWSRTQRVMMQARTVTANPRGRAMRYINDATVQRMDEILSEEGLELLVAGAERTAQASEDDEGKVYCFLPVADLPGVPNAQLRLLCSVGMPSSGTAEIRIEDMSILLEDAQGRMTYDETWSTKGNIKINTTNVVKYSQVSSRVRLEAQISTQMEFPLPDWFPIPDALFTSFVETFTKQLFRRSQEGLLDTLQDRVSRSRD